MTQSTLITDRFILMPVLSYTKPERIRHTSRTRAAEQILIAESRIRPSGLGGAFCLDHFGLGESGVPSMDDAAATTSPVDAHYEHFALTASLHPVT
jgi:hypothetical protein